MKKVLFIFAALLSFGANATTYVPVQLLNPTGSAAGQALVSSGSSSAPAWAAIVNSVSGRTGAITLGVADVSGAASTSGSLSQFATTTSAQLAGVLSDETGSGSAVFNNSPTINTPTINGVTNGSSAAAGSIGEYPSPTNLSNVSLTNVTPANCASVALSAGEWDVSGVVAFVPAASTVITAQYVSINTTSATLGSFGSETAILGSISAGSGSTQIPSPTVRLNVSSSSTAYLIGQAAFTTSTLTCSGFIRARRVH
ncbi:hypothetical protein RI103_06355 [Paraburkholderia sp. FT54]|uniref:hypothetical protein n=1 Tax=Paraburkholderia sp. FT54 TaxID=3074437 RepID=UPI0028772BFF|nr:hypothetical protein [Paraburkholderia sp. FT54]WNC90969.1 hypothetical protein RI103_06355 [Paraburkholderia sp. FT54]